MITNFRYTNTRSRNICSVGIEVPGTAKYFLAILDMTGSFALLCIQFSFKSVNSCVQFLLYRLFEQENTIRTSMVSKTIRIVDYSLTSLILNYVRKFSCKSELFRSCGSREEKYLNFCHYSPLKEDLALQIPFTQEWLYQGWLKSARCFILKDTCKNCFPYCGPSQPPGTIICTSTMSGSFQVIMYSGSVVLAGKIFQWLTPFFFFIIIPYLIRNWPFIWTIFNSLHQGWFVPSLIEIV
jgi:hypothetical protein